MKMVKCEPGYMSNANMWRSPLAGRNFFNGFFEEEKSFIPAVNIKETPVDFQIEMVAPGMNKENFRISLEKNTLKISAEKEQKAEVENEKYTRKEFHFTSFERSFRLNENIAGENISAKYENGILCVILPKKAEAQEKQTKEITVS